MTYRCKVCGKSGMTAPAINRHIALTHRCEDQPTCAHCDEYAEVWATAKHKTAYCRRHANRYGICQWCNRPLEVGFGQGVTACQCATTGVLEAA